MFKSVYALLLLFSGAMSVEAQTVATIQGILLTSNGKPRQYTEIELVPVGSKTLVTDPRLISASSTSGKFTFFDVPPGRYTMSINFDDRPSELSPYDTFFYPAAFDRDDAEVFNIDKDTRTKNVIFRLPSALNLRTVKGRVLWEDGSPAKNVSVGCVDLRVGKANGYGSVKVDNTGNFTVNVFEGRKYQLGAVVFARPVSYPFDEPTIVGGGESNIFIPGPTTGVIEVRVRRAKEGESILNRYIG